MTNQSNAPETRLSLLARLANREDQTAWDEFVELYWPVIYRAARYKGLQDADASDVTQQVLVSVGRALEQRPHDPSRAKFRTWLNMVTRNAALNSLRSLKRKDRPTGDSVSQLQFNTVEDPRTDEEILDREYRKELFRKAARMIQSEFAEGTWQAFWETTVENRPIEDVARELDKNVGSIYAARSRIIRRLREQVERLEIDGH